jgi:hypothetical protein
MKTLSIAPEIERQPDLKQAVDEASQILEKVMGPFASDQATVEWFYLTDSRNRALVRLLVSDWTGTVGYLFAAEELKNRRQMKPRLERLWGDLLEVSAHVQFDGLLGEPGLGEGD